MRVGEQIIGAALCACAMLGTPSSAFSSYLATDVQEATLRLQSATTSYATAARAVASASTPASVEPFASALVDVALATAPDQLARLIDSSLDAVLSIPSDKAAGAVSSVKDAFTGLSDSCEERVPIPAAEIARFSASEAFSRVDASKLKALRSSWAPALDAATTREGRVCLPPRAKLESASLSALQAVRAADGAKVKAAGVQAKVALGSIKKAGAFKLFGGLKTSERDALAVAKPQEREAFKKAAEELSAASSNADDMLALQAAGPPKCFTIGCQTNFEADLWRANSKDDCTRKHRGCLLPAPRSIDRLLTRPAFAFRVPAETDVGEGLERRQAAILSPKGMSKEDMQQRAAEFSAGGK